eukprot:gene10288-10447_t
MPLANLFHKINHWANRYQHKAALPPLQGWVIWDEKSNSFSMVPEAPAGTAAPAWANYSHWSNHKSGFGQLHVCTSSAYSNAIQLQAAGFAEGYLTAPQIFDHWYNWRFWLNHQTSDLYRVFDWLMQHHRWVMAEVGKPRNQGNQFWQAVALVMAQFQGIMDGYNARVVQEGRQLGIDFISMAEWVTLNTMGDIDDILELLFPDDPLLGISNLHKLEPAALAARLAMRGRCSVLIKVTPDLSDLLVAHTTWYTYTGMSRIFKHYNFQLNGQQWKSRLTSMSSYPGMISSMDDFYVLDSHLIVTETSNSVLDAKLWSQVVPQAALSWQRVLAANWLSSSGQDWAHWIQQHNSGTYNNQYMVIDMKHFAPSQELQPGLLTVVEQMPGLVVFGDKTQALERGYWPSYNVPFFPEIYNRSGYPQFKSKLESVDANAYRNVISGLSYQLAPRAKISRRDQGTVNSLESLKKYIRSNSWSTEPYSDGSPFGAICGRGDLDPAHPKASGCNDAKVTSYKLAMMNMAEVVNGPTLGDRDALGPFSWSKFPELAHRGMPDSFDFSFEPQQPNFELDQQ